MVTREKLLDRLRQTTKGWRFSDLQRVAESVGIEVLPGKGDHWKFRAPGHPPVVVDPGRGGHELLRVYVEKVRDLVEEVVGERDEEG
jgi:hypothetical protein